MNIFFVSSNAKEAATMLSNAHVRSQIKESISMLATAHYMLGMDSEELPPPTHRKHPCTLWVMKNRANYQWLYDHLTALLDEYKLRWGNPNWRKKYLPLLEMMPQGIGYMHRVATCPPAVVSKDLIPRHLSWDSIVTAYRAYYNRDKRHLHFWMGREKPDWVIDEDALKEALAVAEAEKQEKLIAAPG